MSRNHNNTNLGQAFVEECEPYHFEYEDIGDAYQLYGFVGWMEDVPELIRLVEGLCELWNIEFYDAHYGEVNGVEVIVFKLPKE